MVETQSRGERKWARARGTRRGPVPRRGLGPPSVALALGRQPARLGARGRSPSCSLVASARSGVPGGVSGERKRPGGGAGRSSSSSSSSERRSGVCVGGGEGAVGAIMSVPPGGCVFHLFIKKKNWS